MKKILIFLLLIGLPIALKAQLVGLGTYASPYNGTFQNDLQWNSTNFPSHKVYINGDVTIDNELLTIEAGMTIIFVSLGADLIITGTGQLNASGTSGSNITFTADANNNGIHGETGERWGHISFQSMTTVNPQNYPSVIDNCIIEYGYKNISPSNIDAYGGGIHTAFTYVTISNSIIRNNYAGWGGGVFVNSGFSPTFVNCRIYNNTSYNCGGGFYFYQNTASAVENCIIYNNYGGTVGGGGVFLGNISGNVRFYNCIFASNTCQAVAGYNILFYYNTNSPSPSFYNTIVWGSNNSIIYAGQSPSASDFNYCAIQGYTSGYTSCINLSGTNGDPAGPNFYNVTPGSEDYSIYFISPCRDAGTTPSPAIPNDYIGNPRIGPYDIGAYEVQYSNWTGATNNLWATSTNWEQNVDPSTGTGDVIIPTGMPNYPTGSTSQNFTIGSGKIMILHPGAKATLGTLTNSGTLNLESDASNISSLLVTTFSGNDANFTLFLTGGGGPNYKWHYVSSPVASLPVSAFAPAHTIDFAQFIESLPTTNLLAGVDRLRWLGIFNRWLWRS